MLARRGLRQARQKLEPQHGRSLFVEGISAPVPGLMPGASCAGHFGERARHAFHLLNPKTNNRIQSRTVDPETGEEVPRSELVKGYEFERGST
jgi:hypothetical protein